MRYAWAFLRTFAPTDDTIVPASLAASNIARDWASFCRPTNRQIDNL